MTEPLSEELARLTKENTQLKIKNAALEKFCGQLSEIIDRLMAAQRKEK